TRGPPSGVRTLSTGPISVVPGVHQKTRTGIVGFNATTPGGSLSGAGGPDSRPVKHGASHHRPSRGASLPAVPCLFGRPSVSDRCLFHLVCRLLLEKKQFYESFVFHTPSRR